MHVFRNMNLVVNRRFYTKTSFQSTGGYNNITPPQQATDAATALGNADLGTSRHFL